eukprot:10927469-Alexandrium_andersonii.AAC.1
MLLSGGRSRARSVPSRGPSCRGRRQWASRLTGLVWRPDGLLAWAGPVSPAMAAALRARGPAAVLSLIHI